jgi:Gene product 88
MIKGIENQLQVLKNIAKWQNDGDAIFEQDLAIVNDLKKINLFTAAASSAKLAKNKRFTKFESYILYMSPATLAFDAIGRRGTLCPYASTGCAAACLNTAGRGRFSSVANARLRKSLYYILFRDQFVAHVFNEVSKLRARLKKGKKLVIRLNGTTDINWAALKVNGLNIFQTYQDVQFYDYTKNLNYALNSKNYNNYHITFSAAENNDSNWQAALDAGLNVAMVFSKLPRLYNGTTVIDGDSHDLRFLDTAHVNEDKTGFIVGLTAKGKAKKDISGFVRQSCGTPKITQKVIINFIDVKQLNKGA